MNLLFRQLEALGFTPTSSRPLSGGMIGEVHALDLKDGERVVVKIAKPPQARLDVEGYMLRYLATHSDLPVPQVLHASPELLVMTYIEGDSQLDASAQTHAAELVAALHNVTAPQSGMERDTILATLDQPNPKTASWIAFFRDHRLLYMAKVALDSGRLPQEVYGRVQRFAEKLDQWLIEPAAASLLHGDLWTTNILAKNGKITGFVDPAVYYGHHEIELAFSTLFNTFGNAFFERYKEIHPIEAGFFEERRAIYNLYPLLVHVRLFGGGYINSIHHTLQQLGF